MTHGSDLPVSGKLHSEELIYILKKLIDHYRPSRVKLGSLTLHKIHLFGSCRNSCRREIAFLENGSGFQ